jgi:hypothetical protein
MANKSLITYGAKVGQVEQTYYAPVAVVPPANTSISQTYCFLAKAEPWPDENNPPIPTQDTKSLKLIFKNIFAVKHITSNDIAPVIKRYDWVSGTIYDRYIDSVDMFELDENGNPTKFYYVKNRYDQVFKCLWNNNGAASTEEPYFEPGTYNASNIFQGIDDYKWKYMYTVDAGSKLKFMDSSWLPVPIGKNIPNPLDNTAGAGNIDVINVLDGGLGYDPANSVVSVVITGDGKDATATAVISGEVITDILVTNAGSNYTYANVAISTSIGFGAILECSTSPVGGHGFDPISELGCNHVMLSVEFNGSEGDVIPTDIDYHQVGLIVNPTTKTLDEQYSNYIPASDSIYKTTTDFIVAPGFGSFTNDEIVYQGLDLATASFFGRVLSFDPATNVVRLLNMTGTPTINSPLKGDTSTTTRTILSYSEPDFSIFSGYISHIENRSGVTRSADGIEQYKFVLGY